MNRSGKSKVIFTMGVARDFCTKLTAFANFLAQGRSNLFRLFLKDCFSQVLKFFLLCPEMRCMKILIES